MEITLLPQFVFRLKVLSLTNVCCKKSQYVEFLENLANRFRGNPGSAIECYMHKLIFSLMFNLQPYVLWLFLQYFVLSQYLHLFEIYCFCFGAHNSTSWDKKTAVFKICNPSRGRGHLGLRTLKNCGLSGFKFLTFEFFLNYQIYKLGCQLLFFYFFC